MLKERHKLHWLRQKDGEETGVFFSRLRQQALKCCFDADQLDERIRDQFVFGIKSVDARETLFYPTCCPLVRSLLREHQRCCARRAMRAW